jgi:excinuclease UvrABC ATPase subunit
MRIIYDARMAYSTCVKCGGTSFELKEAHIANVNFKQNFVQCSSCGGVVGVIPHDDVGTLIRELAARLLK